jgi:protein-disulfide isomerase
MVTSRYTLLCLSAAAVLSVATTAQTQAQAPADTLSVAADKGRILGSDKAPIWMLIVSDFQCPFCRQWHTDTWETLKKEYVATGKVRVAYVNFPLGMHANARPAAITAMCASAQGKFWPVADLLFKTQDKWKDLKDARAFFDSLAKAGGVDAARFKTCVASPVVAKLVDADQVRMARVATQSTPTFFIGASKVEGAQPITVFRRAIDAELAAAAKR